MKTRITSKIPYSCVVGSIMYAMAYTYLDISHVVNVVSRYLSNLGKTHSDVVKWFLRYLWGTSDRKSACRERVSTIV